MKSIFLTGFIFLVISSNLLIVNFSFIPLKNVVLAETESTEVLQLRISTDENQLVKNTPIIIKVKDHSLLSLKFNTSTVYYESIELPSQTDDLDGDGIIDEIVFQLPSDIDEGTTQLFDLHLGEESLDVNQSVNPNIRISQDLYNLSYSKWLSQNQSITFKNDTGHLAPTVHDIGEVIWVETDWAILCLYISAAWRQSSWKHIILKDSNWDVVMAKYDPWLEDLEPYEDTYPSWTWSRWLWSRFMYESDPGWHTAGVESSNLPWNLWERIPDEVKVAKVGDVRTVIQTYSGIGHNDNIEIQDKLHAVRTYTIYSGFEGIAQNFRLEGGDEDAAAESMTALSGGPLVFHSKCIDLGMDYTTNPWTTIANSNHFDKVVTEGGATDRYQPTKELRKLDLSKLRSAYLGMYSSSSKNGFVYNWGDFAIKDNIASIVWSGDELVIQYSFEQFPIDGIDRILIPFCGSSTGGNPESYMTTLNDYWSSKYTLEVTRHEITPFPLIISFFSILYLGVIVLYWRKRSK